MKEQLEGRRKFLKQSALLGIGMAAAPILGSAQIEEGRESLYIIGPRKGYTPQIGTLLSTMEMMTEWLFGTIKDLSVEQLDFLLDNDANSIGAMALHLAASEKKYQIHTFDGVAWGKWSEEVKAKWEVASSLGQEARDTIKGNPASYYMDAISEVREATKAGFAQRDDDWLMEVDEDWAWGPTNNYCKWFHVCEHISNHRGQMKLIAKRF